MPETTKASFYWRSGELGRINLNSKVEVWNPNFCGLLGLFDLKYRHGCSCEDIKRCAGFKDRYYLGTAIQIICK